MLTPRLFGAAQRSRAESRAAPTRPCSEQRHARNGLDHRIGRLPIEVPDGTMIFEALARGGQDGVNLSIDSTSGSPTSVRVGALPSREQSRVD
jgi:hypothetical protein